MSVGRYNSREMKILVTGGAGYIGSHTVVELLELHHDVTVLDDLSNGSYEALQRVQKLTGKSLEFYKVDLCNEIALGQILKGKNFDVVVHFAGLKAVGESVEQPLRYYETNLRSTINLCKNMSACGIRRLIFSSSATVYGYPKRVPITEDMPINPTNPYGQTKAMIERILQDQAAADKGLGITCLRYFNPIGAHPSGYIGEDPKGVPNNLLPFVAQVAVGKHPKVKVFGMDYDTPDGTGVRDYIHVVDLAKGHVAALKSINKSGGFSVYNLGSGKGHSVMEVIKSFEQACGKPIPYEICPRRPGDVAVCYANPSKANKELHWTAEKTLTEACEDAWRWQSLNPNGYN